MRLGSKVIRGALLGALLFLLLAGVASAQGRDPGFDKTLTNIGLPLGWGATKGAGVTVAVLDNGIALLPDFQGRITAPYDFVNNDTDANDETGHGTLVASVIAAGTDGEGIEGVCPQCQIMPEKIIDGAGRWKSERAIPALSWAGDHGAKVVNLSLSQDPFQQPIPDLNAAVNALISRGVTVVLSSGNGDKPGQNDSHGSASCDINHLAADNPAAIRVAAVLPNNNQLASYSNYGSCVDIAAYAPINADTTSNNFEDFYGTSAAAPQVSGAAALLLAYKPGLSPAQVKNILMSTGTKVPGLAVACGCIVNVLNALKALGYTPPPPVTVTVRKAGTGTGTIIYPDGCSQTSCTVAPGETVELDVLPDNGSMFAGWTGAPGCGKATACSFKASSNVILTATFSKRKLPLKVSKTGTGTVTSSPVGINCGIRCVSSFSWNAPVTLRAKPATGYAVSRWVGCRPIGALKLTCITAKLTKAASVRVIFVKK